MVLQRRRWRQDILRVCMPGMCPPGTVSSLSIVATRSCHRRRRRRWRTNSLRFLAWLL